MRGEHQIEKLIFEFDLHENDPYYAQQQRASGLLRGQILDRIERTFDKLSDDGRVIRINKLEVNIESPQADWSVGLPDKIEHQLFEAISNELGGVDGVEDLLVRLDLGPDPETSNVTVTRPQDDVISSIIYFLKTGRLPWWMNGQQEFSIDQAIHRSIQKSPEGLKRVLVDNLRSRSFRTRLIRQISWEQFVKVIQLLNPEDRSVPDRLVVEVLKSESAREQRELILHALLSPNGVGRREVDSPEGLIGYISNYLKTYGALPEEELKALLLQEGYDTIVSDVWGKNNNYDSKEGLLKVVSSDDNKENSHSTFQDEEKIVASHAGLVIIVPYMIPFFSELGLLEDGSFKDETSQHDAAYMLHYLATGDIRKVEEHELVMEKILVGIDLDDEIFPQVKLSKEAKNECDNLLTSIAENWKALKTESGELVRHNFLNRDGLISRQDSTWTVQIERETIDVLLDKLPWGISMLQIPWTKEMLVVEW